MSYFKYEECPYCKSDNIEGTEIDFVTAEQDGSV